VQECQSERAKAFEDSCSRCHLELVDLVDGCNGGLGVEKVDHKTPSAVICTTQV
jgi:hypothetical protein